MEIARLLLLFLIALSLCYTFLATYFTRSFFKKKRQEEVEPEPQWPPVSIIKPVAGVEKSTLENFMSFCDQDYPHYEIVFSLSGKQDPAISLIEELKKNFPDREIRWTIGNPNRGSNYKVGNLIEAVRNAKYDILAISDSDMQVGRDYLREVIAIFLRGKAGLVTCLYRGTHLDNFLTGLQALSIQTDFIPRSPLPV